MEMKLNKYSILGAVFSLLITLASCSKLLDQDPKASITVKTAWNNESDINAELAAAYSFLRSPLTIYFGHYAYGEFRAGDVKNAIAYNLENNVLGTDYYAVDNWRDWSRFYKAIAQCNLILEKIEGISDKEFSAFSKKHYISEVKFIRAFTYFYLLRIWGEVPINKKGVNRDPLPKSSMEDVFEFCLQDIEGAMEDLPWSYTDAKMKAVRASKASALALRAHVYMFQGNDLEGEKACKDLMDNAGLAKIQLLPFSDMAKVMKGKSAEGIFEINFNDTEGSRFSTLAGTFVRPPEVANKPGEASTIPLKVADELFPIGTSDKRATWLNNRSNSLDIVVNKFNIKAPDFTVTAPKFQANIIMFRYADIILLRAEALANLNRGDEAIPLINMIRERASAPLYDSAIETDVKFAVAQERRKELIGEGHRWYDMMRNNTISTYNIYITPDMVERGAAYWPVPASAFSNNPFMTQNAFWAD